MKFDVGEKRINAKLFRNIVDSALGGIKIIRMSHDTYRDLEWQINDSSRTPKERDSDFYNIHDAAYYMDIPLEPKADLSYGVIEIV